MARPNWEWIRVDVLLPEHAKVEGLSDKAFRALVELWCYCGRQHSDGAVPAARWRKVSPKARAELLAAGLADPLLTGDPTSGVTMHDYLGHQRSRESIDELAQKRAEAGRKGAEKRWQEP
ncbi:MAG TPA: hypothetical protein VMA73_22000 [Streptosporangiaceae bacterium]|nr:hypothetical protein [Streptosporangiaceae bacterium]